MTARVSSLEIHGAEFEGTAQALQPAGQHMAAAGGHVVVVAPAGQTSSAARSARSTSSS